jgi:hypothetical protein
MMQRSATISKLLMGQHRHFSTIVKEVGKNSILTFAAIVANIATSSSFGISIGTVNATASSFVAVIDTAVGYTTYIIVVVVGTSSTEATESAYTH